VTKLKQLREVITIDIWQLPCNEALMRDALPLLLEAACLLQDISPHLDKCILPANVPALCGWGEQVQTVLEKLR
jgi:hypothetical protein